MDQEVHLYLLPDYIEVFEGENHVKYYYSHELEGPVMRLCSNKLGIQRISHSFALGRVLKEMSPPIYDVSYLQLPSVPELPSV